VPLRIAFDLDGVFADMEGALTREAEAVFGQSMTRRLMEGGGAAAPPSGTSVNGEKAAATASDDPAPAEPGEREITFSRLQLTSRQERRLWTHVGSLDNFWETLQEIEPGSLASLAALAADRRWEVIFLTRRPPSAGATSQIQSQRWLEAKGFRLPSVYVVQGSRGRIAAALALDFVIDDTPENCLDVVADSSARAVLVWREDEKHLPSAARRLGIGVVRSVDECLGVLAHIDAPVTPGVMDRVLRALGVK